MSAPEVLTSIDQVAKGSFDSFIVLGRQYYKGSSRLHVEQSRSQLSNYSMWNIMAAIILWRKGVRIVVSGNEGSQFPQQAHDIFANTPTYNPPLSALTPMDVHSPGTLDSARNVPPLLESEGLENPLVISNGVEYVKRVVNGFKKNGCPVTGVVSAMIVAEYFASTSSEVTKQILAQEQTATARLEESLQRAYRIIESGSRIGPVVSKAESKVIKLIRP